VTVGTMGKHGVALNSSREVLAIGNEEGQRSSSKGLSLKIHLCRIVHLSEGIEMLQGLKGLIDPTVIKKLQKKEKLWLEEFRSVLKSIRDLKIALAPAYRDTNRGILPRV